MTNTITRAWIAGSLALSLAGCATLGNDRGNVETFTVMVVGIPHDHSHIAFGVSGPTDEWSSSGTVPYCHPGHSECAFEPDTTPEDHFVLITKPENENDFGYTLRFPARELGEVRCTPMASPDSFICHARLLPAKAGDH